MGKLTLAIAVFAATLSTAGAVGAQNYPSRPITVVVPGPAGGPPDTLLRILSDRMTASLGQPIVIENAGGAAGTIAVGRVARAAPDGYTVSIGHVASHVFSSIVYGLQHDALKDLMPVALLTTTPTWIIAANALPAKDVKELIAWLKANPDVASAGIVGAGSPAQLCGMHFQNLTGTRFKFVSYRGGAPLMQDLIGGHIQLACVEASNTRELVQSGKVKAYAVMSAKRWAKAPDIPTIDEAGVPGLHIPFWHGLWVPKGTPAEAIAKLNAAAVRALADTEVRQRLAELGQELPPDNMQTPEALGAFHRAELEKWAPIIKAANIKPE